MALDEDREFVLTIGPGSRSVTLTPTIDGTVVLAVEDPHAVTVVEMTQAELAALVDGLAALKKEDGR